MPQFIVCPACEGTGRDASTAYVITGEDLDIQCGDDFDERREYVRAVANLTQKCPLCLGKNVVTPDEGEQWEEDAYDRALMDQERYWEMRMGC